MDGSVYCLQILTELIRMYEYYDYEGDDINRPDGANTPGQMGGPGGMPEPFSGGQPMFGQPSFGQPMFGQPSFGQPPFGQPPFGQPPFGQNQVGAPSGPPPAFTPNQAAAAQGIGGAAAFKVNPGAIRPCRFRYVYIWLNNGRSFWAWLTFIGRNSVAGWRWNGFRWVFFGIDSDNIVAFLCY